MRGHLADEVVHRVAESALGDVDVPVRAARLLTPRQLGEVQVLNVEHQQTVRRNRSRTLDEDRLVNGPLHRRMLGRLLGEQADETLLIDGLRLAREPRAPRIPLRPAAHVEPLALPARGVNSAQGDNLFEGRGLGQLDLGIEPISARGGGHVGSFGCSSDTFGRDPERVTLVAFGRVVWVQTKLRRHNAARLDPRRAVLGP